MLFLRERGRECRFMYRLGRVYEPFPHRCVRTTMADSCQQRVWIIGWKIALRIGH